MSFNAVEEIFYRRARIFVNSQKLFEGQKISGFSYFNFSSKSVTTKFSQTPFRVSPFKNKCVFRNVYWTIYQKEFDPNNGMNISFFQLFPAACKHFSVWFFESSEALTWWLSQGLDGTCNDDQKGILGSDYEKKSHKLHLECFEVVARR